MKSNLYIPKKIHVGFQNRSDTFTGKLAYVIYEDEKGVLRKEQSWNGWKSKSIPAKVFDNNPRSGFVFNKGVQRDGHFGSGRSVIRVYDDRDFEFEISVDNLVGILMHSDVSKRDIVEECIFAWDGKDLVLLPVNSEEYRASVENTRKQNTKFSTKDLVLGRSYLSKREGNVVYLGYHDWSEEQYTSNYSKKQMVSLGKKHVFYNKEAYKKFFTLEGAALVEAVSEDICSNYAHLVDSLHKLSNMKKIGSFSVTKGFDLVGYKKVNKDVYKVALDFSQNKYVFEKFNLEHNNDVPKCNKEENRSYYYLSKSKYQQEIENSIPKNNIQAIKDYLLKEGFGELIYTKSTGEKMTINL